MPALWLVDRLIRIFPENAVKRFSTVPVGGICDGAQYFEESVATEYIGDPRINAFNIHTDAVDVGIRFIL